MRVAVMGALDFTFSARGGLLVQSARVLAKNSKIAVPGLGLGRWTSPRMEKLEGMDGLGWCGRWGNGKRVYSIYTRTGDKGTVSCSHRYDSCVED